MSGKIKGVGNSMRCVMKPCTGGICDTRFASREPGTGI